MAGPTTAGAAYRTLRTFSDESFWRGLFAAARAGKAGASEAFLEAVAALRASGDAAVIYDIVGGKVEASFVSVAFDWPGFEAALQTAYFPALAGTYVAGASHASDVAPEAARVSLVGLSLDPVAVEVRNKAIAWAEEAAGRLVTNVSEATQAGIGELIAQASASNFPVRLTAGEIRGLVGLTKGQEGTLARYAATLADRPGLSRAKAAQLIDTRASVLLRARSEVIAKTELRGAAVNGQRGFWRSSPTIAGTYVREIVAILLKACPFCAGAVGQIAEIDAPYPGEYGDGPLFHPLCECTERIIPRGEIRDDI